MNAFLPECFDWLILRTIALTVGFAVATVAWALLSKRVSAAFGHALWLLPFLLALAPVERLLPPRTIQLPATWNLVQLPLSSVPTSTPVANGGVAPGPIEAGAPNPKPEAHPEASMAQPVTAPSARLPAALPPASDTPVDGRLLLVAPWAIVSFGLLLAWLVNEGRMRRRLRAQPPLAADHPVYRRVQRLSKLAGLRRAPQVRIVAGLSSPAVRGLWRPELLLAPAMAARATDGQARWILLHELAHLRRRDPAAQTLQRFGLILFWFHPLAWWSAARLDLLRECACDDMARLLSPRLSARACARAFLDAIEAARPSPLPRLTITSLFITPSFSRRRFMRLLDPHHPLKAKSSAAEVLSLAGLFLCSVCVVGSLSASASAQERPMARPQAAPADESESPAVARNDSADGLAPRSLVNGALDALVDLQHKDGRFLVHKNPNVVHHGEHGEVHVTALCLDALHSLGTKPVHAAAANRAEAWLLAQQDADTGLIGKKISYVWMTGHGVALEVLLKRQAAQANAARKAAIAKAAAFVQSARNPYKAWRFEVRTGENDSRVTSIMLRALHAAQEQGIGSYERDLEHGRGFLDSIWDTDTGRVGFLRLDDHTPRLYPRKQAFPGDAVEEPTAIVLHSLLTMGESPATSRPLRRSIGLLLEFLPTWSKYGGTIDYSYWHFGTLAFDRLGGWQEKAWDDALREALVKNAHRASDGTVRWPCVDAWSDPGMEAWTTAINAMTLAAALPR